MQNTRPYGVRWQRFDGAPSDQGKQSRDMHERLHPTCPSYKPSEHEYDPVAQCCVVRLRETTKVGREQARPPLPRVGRARSWACLDQYGHDDVVDDWVSGSSAPLICGELACCMLGRFRPQFKLCRSMEEAWKQSAPGGQMSMSRTPPSRSKRGCRRPLKCLLSMYSPPDEGNADQIAECRPAARCLNTTTAVPDASSIPTLCSSSMTHASDQQVLSSPVQLF